MLLKHALTALTLACTTLSAAVLPANGLAALESQNDLKILTGLIKKDPYLVNLYKTTKDVTIVAAIDSSFPIKDINDPLYSRDFVRLIAVALLIEGIYPSSAVTTDPKYPSTKQDDPNYAKTSRGKVPARLQTKNGKDTVKYNYVTSDFVQNDIPFVRGVLHKLSAPINLPGSISVTAQPRFFNNYALGNLSSRGLLTQLDNRPDTTVFTVTNAVWDALSPSQRDNLSTQYLKYYVLPGVYYQNTFDGRSVKTLNGGNVKLSGFRKDGTGTLKVNERAVVVNEDVLTTNGAIHVLDQILHPPN